MKSVVKSIVRAFLFALLMVGAIDSAFSQGVPPAAPPMISDLPILGIAQVTFKVSDLPKARAFYDGVLGFAEAFDLKDAKGKINSAYFKVNDDQYIELTPNLQAGELVRLARVVIQTSDIEKLHAIYAERGLEPSAIAKGPDGNPIFRVLGPDDAKIDFMQYANDSQQARVRGKFLDERRISTHLLHAGILLKDRALMPFYRDKLGFGQRLPGGRGEYIETPSSDSNLETKNPSLDPNNPAMLAQYTREVSGAVNHLCLEVPDMRATRDLAQKRGGYDDLRVRVHIGNVRRWLMFLFDPDGSRIEFMESNLQDTLPPMTVMAPGAVAPPILPATPGKISWP